MMANGIHASGGIGRNTRANQACVASTRGKSATAMPHAMPSTEPRNSPIR